jgi:hypothetical protein
VIILTLAQIITKAKRKKSTGESDANLIIDLNGIQNKLWMELRQYQEAFGRYSIKEYTTVADQLEYALEAACEWENILLVRCSTDTTEETWDVFEYAGEKDDITIGKFWRRMTDDKIALTVDNAEISTAGLTLQVYYFPEPSAFTATSDTPILKAKYHDLFVYALAYEICLSGDNPDVELGSMLKQEYYELLEKVKSDLKVYETLLPMSENSKEGYF